MRIASLMLLLIVVQQQTPFRARVDLIRLDVAAVDASGRPVVDLRADEFSVSVDGAPRRVLFARHFGTEGLRAARSDEPVSVASNVEARPGRILVLVADLESVTAGYERPVFEAASRFVDTLGPNDAVGLVAIPGKGVEVTRDHGKVRDAIKALRGWDSASPASPYTLTAREAEGFRNRDKRLINEVLDRECTGADGSCQRMIEAAVMPTIINAERRMQSMAGALKGLYGALRQVEAPRSVVILSAGLEMTEGSSGPVRDLEAEARASGVTTTVIQIHQPESDASRRTRGGVPRSAFAEGLDRVAGVTDGRVYYGVGTAAGVFDRIRAEVLNSYEVVVEGTPADFDGKRHRLKVSTGRDGVTLTTRREFVATPNSGKASNPADLLRSPILHTEVPFSVSTYMTRGEAPDSLKAILLIELSGSSSAAGEVPYAVAIEQDGRTVFETADRVARGGRTSTFGAQLAPGRYQLRAGVVDPEGRAGSLEMPIVVGLRQAGAVQLSDLIIGTGTTTFTPSVRISAAGGLTAILEMYAGNPADLDGLQVSFELRRPGATAVAAVAANIQKTSLERRRIATAVLNAASLEPGTWFATAVVRRNETTIGQVSRSIQVE